MSPWKGVEAAGAGLRDMNRDQRDDVGDATDRMRDISRVRGGGPPAGVRTRGIAAARQADVASFCHTKILGDRGKGGPTWRRVLSRDYVAGSQLRKGKAR